MSTATIGAGTRAGQQPPDELWRWTAVEIARASVPG
jgi:hypothetical protein